MKKKLTVYCIKYGKAPKAFIAVADNSIPLKILNYYTDINNSFIYESFININHISLIKKICSDTGKTAILNRTHNNKEVRKFIDKVIGYEVIWKEYCFSIWTKSFSGIHEYVRESQSTIEIDHPINLEDKIIISIVQEGQKSIEKSQKEFKKIKVKYKRKKKNEK